MVHCFYWSCSSFTTSMNLNDYKIIKEGDAEILMHLNEVFNNKAQVNNRDMSIAVLRAFILKRKQEYEAMLSKRTKAAQKVSENGTSEPVMEDGAHAFLPEDHNGSIREFEGNDEVSAEEMCNTTEELVQTTEKCDAVGESINISNGKVQRELKPPRVLEALSTSGLRALRYPREIEGIGQVVALDNDKGVSRIFHHTKNKNNSVKYLPCHGPVVPQEFNYCGTRFNMGGPIWSAPIQDQEWMTSLLADVKSMKERYPAYDRISAVLTTISEELPRVPLFLSLHNLCATLNCTSPSAIIFRSAVINAGYHISGTRVNPQGLKSDAPMDVISDIMRCWVKTHPVKAQPADQPGSVIFAKEPVLQANFARAVSSLSKAQARKVARFLPNPERHWVLNLGQDVKFLASMSLFWVKHQLMEFSIRKRMKNLKVRGKRHKIISQLSSQMWFFLEINFSVLRALGALYFGF